MSRIGKQPIKIPEGVEVKLDNNSITVKGPLGTLEQKLSSEFLVELKDNFIKVVPVLKREQTSALWGLTRALIANMVKGVSVGFEKKLEINGVGYRAAVEQAPLEKETLAGQEFLILNVGFSHPVKLPIPSGVNVNIEKNIIAVSGIDKQLIGQFAADIRAVKPPEPYKGKGIRYIDEVVRRKPGKKAATMEK